MNAPCLTACWECTKSTAVFMEPMLASAWRARSGNRVRGVPRGTLASFGKYEPDVVARFSHQAPYTGVLAGCVSGGRKEKSQKDEVGSVSL